jgi:hypothetical protein
VKRAGEGGGVGLTYSSWSAGVVKAYTSLWQWWRYTATINLGVSRKWESFKILVVRREDLEYLLGGPRVLV